jgi:hypothetical protein
LPLDEVTWNAKHKQQGQHQGPITAAYQCAAVALPELRITRVTTRRPKRSVTVSRMRSILSSDIIDLGAVAVKCELARGSTMAAYPRVKKLGFSKYLFKANYRLHAKKSGNSSLGSGVEVSRWVAEWRYRVGQRSGGIARFRPAARLLTLPRDSNGTDTLNSYPVP